MLDALFFFSALLLKQTQKAARKQLSHLTKATALHHKLPRLQKIPPSWLRNVKLAPLDLSDDQNL